MQGRAVIHNCCFSRSMVAYKYLQVRKHSIILYLIVSYLSEKKGPFPTFTTGPTFPSYRNALALVPGAK